MGISTRWYITLEPNAILKPPMLHTTTDLEVGDLFINKYSSTSYKKDVLQVWLLLPAMGGEGFQWKQVRYLLISDRTESLDYSLNIQVSGGETLHPKLPNFVLAFQPSDLSSPSWIKRVTERRTGRVRPRVLGPGEGTFIE